LKGHGLLFLVAMVCLDSLQHLPDAWCAGWVVFAALTVLVCLPDDRWDVEAAV
jgi:hypothetical protein